MPPPHRGWEEERPVMLTYVQREHYTPQLYWLSSTRKPRSLSSEYPPLPARTRTSLATSRTARPRLLIPLKLIAPGSRLTEFMSTFHIMIQVPAQRFTFNDPTTMASPSIE